jgi:hypothetical protein
MTGGKITGGLVPKDFDQMYRIAHIFANSGMIPKHFTSAAQVFVAMELGMEIGLPPMASVQNIAVINGRPSVWGDAALGVVRASGAMAKFQEDPVINDDGEIMGYDCYAERTNGDSAKHRFTVKMAQRAGLWDKAGPWKQYPERMMQMRARGFVLRDLFPDVLRGVYLREELDGNDVEAVEVQTIKDPLTGLEAQVAELQVETPIPEELPAPPADVQDAEVVEDTPQEEPEPPSDEPEAPEPPELAPQVQTANEDYLLRMTMEIKAGKPSNWRKQYEELVARGVAAYTKVGWEIPEVEFAADVCKILDTFECKQIDKLEVNDRPDFKAALVSFVEQAEENAEKANGNG